MAIDGKTVRRSTPPWAKRPFSIGQRQWASSHGLALGQTREDEKSNEITAIPKLLAAAGARLHHHASTPWAGRGRYSREIIEAQADYLLAVKENQGRLYDDVRDLFEGAEEYDFEGVPYDFARTLNKPRPPGNPSMLGHHGPGTGLDYLQNRQQWANLNAVVKVHGSAGDGNRATVHSRY